MKRSLRVTVRNESVSHLLAVERELEEGEERICLDLFRVGQKVYTEAKFVGL